MDSFATNQVKKNVLLFMNCCIVEKSATMTERVLQSRHGTLMRIANVPLRELDVGLTLFRRGRARRIGPSHYWAQDGQRHGIGAAEFLFVMPKGAPPSRHRIFFRRNRYPNVVDPFDAITRLIARACNRSG
jgi:hypothetical protein